MLVTGNIVGLCFPQVVSFSLSDDDVATLGATVSEGLRIVFAVKVDQAGPEGLYSGSGRAANRRRARSPCRIRARTGGDDGRQRSPTGTANGLRPRHAQVDPLRETTF